jgi:hypothetical protein
LNHFFIIVAKVADLSLRSIITVLTSSGKYLLTMYESGDIRLCFIRGSLREL